MPQLFEIQRCGDPFNKTGWEVREYKDSFDERFPVYRGDLSPTQGRDNTVRLLRRLYPGCKIRVTR